MDFVGTVNAGQLLVIVTTFLTNVISLTVIIMVIKSDVRSLREAEARQETRLAKIEGAMDKQTEILVKQNSHELEIGFLKTQIEELIKAQGETRLVRYIGHDFANPKPPA